MTWKGKFFGAWLGLLVTRSVWGAVVGAVIGHLLDQGGRSASRGAGTNAPPVSAVFFRTTFELMGYVAKSDGRVSEAEIEAARSLMKELRLGPAEIDAAIACFRTGKSPGFDPARSLAALRAACGSRHDLLQAFMELQLRAALAGNGLSPPARAILVRVADRLGISGPQFARLEAGVRARPRGRGAAGPRQPAERPLAECYAELGITADRSDPEVVRAYRRQMSRHHPDKLVANGLPESMAEFAKEKTQRIQEAYEAIRTARGMR